jgi:hypothetical protein
VQSYVPRDAAASLLAGRKFLPRESTSELQQLKGRGIADFIIVNTYVWNIAKIAANFGVSQGHHHSVAIV